MVTSSNSDDSDDSDDDLDSFLNEIDEEVANINPEITLDLKHRKFTCFDCGSYVVVPIAYRMLATCPDCFAYWRRKYLRHHPQ